MEEKIYSRAVNKSTLACSVNDGKDLLRLFTAQEVSNINAAPVSWVQCDQVRLHIPTSTHRKSRVSHFFVCFCWSFCLATVREMARPSSRGPV